ncbi:MAG: ice-binding family protein [Ignavibacteriaceae bacterium]|jgi:hypothetical protein
MKTNIFLHRVLNRSTGFISIIGLVGLMTYTTTFSQTINLGTASNFAVLAAAGITNTGITALTGDIGSYPTATITGFPPGIFSGTNHGNDEITHQAMLDLNSAYIDAEGRAGISIGSELGGTTLTAGVYNSAATFAITGTLTLNGNATDVFIFQAGSTLITATDSRVTLNGVLWTNIFWQVGSSSTLGVNSMFEGTIMANTSITANSGATVHGRLLAGAVTATGAVVLNANTALPVELTSFTAALNRGAVVLNWNTATEVNNYGFEIESRRDNANFEKIGFVKGNGNSNSVKNYFFTDTQTLSGKNFYRLKQIDNDGVFEYSKVVEVDFNQPQTFELLQNYPNPFNPTTKISYAIPVDGRVQLLIYGITGEVVKSLVNEYQTAGIYTVNFNAAALPSGIYFYKIITNNFLQVKKMSIIK